MQDWSLYTSLILGGAFFGALLVAALALVLQRGRGYGYPPPYRRRYYYRRQNASGFWLLLVLAILLLLMLSKSGISLQQANALSLPAANWAPSSSPAPKAAPRTCYLEFGAYPSWGSAQDARRRLQVEHQQVLEVLRCREAGSPYRVVYGPFRNFDDAEQYRKRYELRARVTVYD